MTNTRPAHGRGRPAVFNTALRTQYLDAVRAGMYLGAAADHIGIHRNVPTRTARTDRQFAQALTDAKAEGRKARVEDVAHGEARYNNYGCRCRTCTAAATRARAERRAEPQPEQDRGESGQILDLRTGPESPIPLLLRIAS
ncbi:hypothetical protein ABZ826_23665 [Streptomyces sp. NPDC047515]|uniref:hypothetical protein n=1 Tax=Streptomyces sp. NPDC047515 TaxID=3155380 RepID=UPI0033E3984E